MDQLVITEKTLDVRKTFRQKSPRLSKWIPAFIYSYIEKKIRQHELNDFLYQNKDKHGLDFVDASLETLGVSLKVIGKENILPNERITVAANHPIGGPEGLGLMRIVGDIRQDFSFLANDILMQIPNINQFFTPVNTLGSNEDYLRYFKETFMSDKAVLIFPAGLVSRKQQGEIKDLLWKSSYISRATKYDRKIIPCHIDGKNSNFFYNLAYWRARLGIKANLEMFLLPDEMFKQNGKTITFTFGKPVSHTIFDERMSRHKWSAIFKDYVYKLKDNPDLVFDLDYVKSLDLDL